MTGPCPLCDRPIADGAYVCHLCARELAVLLLETARSWHQLETTLAREDVVDVVPNQPPKHTPVLLGPFCRPYDENAPRRPEREVICDHESCSALVDSKMRDELATRFPETGGRTPGLPFHYNASEAGFVIDDTASWWARFVADIRGLRIPNPPTPTRPLTAAPTPPRTRGEPRCDCCDLPTYSCQRRTAS